MTVTPNVLRYVEFFFPPEAFFGIILKSTLLGGENWRYDIFYTITMCKFVVEVFTVGLLKLPRKFNKATQLEHGRRHVFFSSEHA